MVPSSVRVPVPSAFAFPHGALGLGVEPVRNFEAAPGSDDQARDKETGERVWAVTVMDLDPLAAKFGREKVKVKIASAVRPVLPASKLPGYPPVVEFVDLVLVPWVDDSKCRASGKCKARLSWSMRAADVVDATAVVPVPVAA